MKVENGFTFCSLVRQPLLTTIMAALLNAASTSGHANYLLQDPAVNQVGGTPSPAVRSHRAAGLNTRGPRCQGNPKNFENGRGVS